MKIQWLKSKSSLMMMKNHTSIRLSRCAAGKNQFIWLGSNWIILLFAKSKLNVFLQALKLPQHIIMKLFLIIFSELRSNNFLTMRPSRYNSRAPTNTHNFCIFCSWGGVSPHSAPLREKSFSKIYPDMEPPAKLSFS